MFISYHSPHSKERKIFLIKNVANLETYKKKPFLCSVLIQFAWKDFFFILPRLIDCCQLKVQWCQERISLSSMYLIYQKRKVQCFIQCEDLAKTKKLFLFSVAHMAEKENLIQCSSPGMKRKSFYVVQITTLMKKDFFYVAHLSKKTDLSYSVQLTW